MPSPSKPDAALAIVTTMDDWEAAAFIEKLGAHFHGYDFDETLPQRLRDDAEPRGNCDQLCDEGREAA